MVTLSTYFTGFVFLWGVRLHKVDEVLYAETSIQIDDYCDKGAIIGYKTYFIWEGDLRSWARMETSSFSVEGLRPCQVSLPTYLLYQGWCLVGPTIFLATRGWTIP